MVTQCCQCQRIRQEDRWVTLQESPLAGEPVSHSYCPHCATRLMCEIKACHSPNRAFTPAPTDSSLEGVGQQKRRFSFEER
jgi:uncharacterized protein YlaI